MTPRSQTPVNPLIDNLRGEMGESPSRPSTPTVIGLDKDEREDFLKRENELTDQLAEKVKEPDLSLVPVTNKALCPIRKRFWFPSTS